MVDDSIKDLLEAKYLQYCQPEFIENDPVSIPHLFTKNEDIEIAAFFAATLAWGRRDLICRAARNLMQMMDFAPYDFVLHARKQDIERMKHFKYRTFQFDDLEYYLVSLSGLYRNGHSLRQLFEQAYVSTGNIWYTIELVREIFFSQEHKVRTRKHFPSPASGSACKRIHMFLRWMVRRDGRGVDFGIWTGISPGALMCPLDVHTARVARSLGLLHRKQNDRDAVIELTERLKVFDAADPVKYDYALFGLSIFEKF